MRNLKLSEPNDYKNAGNFHLLTNGTLIVAKRKNNMLETATPSQRLSNTQSYWPVVLTTWNFLFGHVLLGRRKINVCILSNISESYLIFARLQIKVESLIETTYCETLQY
jgi:hypothetical protein